MWLFEYQVGGKLGVFKRNLLKGFTYDVFQE